MEPHPDPGPLKLGLNAYLLRSSVAPPDAWSEQSLAERRFFVWNDGYLQPCTNQDLEQLAAAAPGDVVLAVLRNPTDPPTWQTFLRLRMGVPDIDVAPVSHGAVLFCAVEEQLANGSRMRWVAWAFGSGSRALSRKARDPRFGLLVALNLLIRPLLASIAQGDRAGTALRPRLRGISFRTTAPYVQQTDQRAARDIPVEGFRLDQSTDLIATVGGSAADPALSTSTIQGGRSLRFQAWVDRVEDLVGFAETAFARSRTGEYKELFEWVDNIRLVEDEELSQRLRRRLAQRLLADPTHPSIDTVLPDDLLKADRDRSIHWIALPGERGTSHDRTTLTPADVARLLKDKPDPSAALDRELRFFDESRDQLGTATALECLSADLTLDGQSFIAYDGDFYAISKNFTEDVTSRLKNVAESEIYFPAYHGETEPADIGRIEREHKDSFAVIDGQTIKLPGESPIEACDLVARSGALVHLKRKGKSPAPPVRQARCPPPGRGRYPRPRPGTTRSIPTSRSDRRASTAVNLFPSAAAEVAVDQFA